MFSLLKLCVAAVLAATLVAAGDVQISGEPAPASGGEIKITWDPASIPDKVFSVEVVHPNLNNAIAIGNNLKSADGNATLPLPMLQPGRVQDEYTIELVAIDDINNVYATSDEFSVAAPASTSESATPSATATESYSYSAAAMTSGSMASGSMHMSGMSIATSASASGSALASAASAKASSPATSQRVHGAGAALSSVGVVLVGLASAAWVL
ncbi:hypothetical protein C8R46DRAFT_1206216 [Mycena filopes]|nr:hypothetical protein C8R46DRAFT_1206216 [Mycena filopes]